jgi:imidazole glycerol phosphate synthase glutamine amidotransferase subunit
MIGVIDYGAGNVRSVCNALKRLSIQHRVCRCPEEVTTVPAIILPGVGHFGQLSDALDRMRLRQAIKDSIYSGKPFLGICLGMQILFEVSEESPNSEGLKIIKGSVKKLANGLRTPHTGWNSVYPSQSSMVFFDEANYFYFAHSYAVSDCDIAIGKTTYGDSFVSAVEQNNVFGVQFHPEKSGRIGEELLRRFAELSKC